jgi:hypothetical protein
MVGEEKQNPMEMTRRGIDAVHKDVRKANRLALVRNGYFAINWNILTKLIKQYGKV